MKTEDRRQITDDGEQMTEGRRQRPLNAELFEFGSGNAECGLRPLGAIGAYAPEGMRNDGIASLFLFI